MDLWISFLYTSVIESVKIVCKSKTTITYLAIDMWFYPGLNFVKCFFAILNFELTHKRSFEIGILYVCSCFIYHLYEFSQNLIRMTRISSLETRKLEEPRKDIPLFLYTILVSLDYKRTKPFFGRTNSRPSIQAWTPNSRWKIHSSCSKMWNHLTLREYCFNLRINNFPFPLHYICHYLEL